MSGPLPWRVFVDTGGTFTDAVGEAPDGALRQVKVLSSGALRATVLDRPAPDRLRVALGPGIAPASAVGLRCGDDAGPRVATCTPDGTLAFDGPVPPHLAPGAAFDLVGGGEAPLLAARCLLGIAGDAPLPRLEMRLATTRGTNALLERSGAPVAFFTTRGFADLLDIGTQQRPALFARRVVLPPPLHAATAEVPGRRAADGTVVEPLDPDAVRAEARRLRADGFTAAAVALAHAYRDPSDETTVAALLREEGFTTVVTSSAVAPLQGLLARARTAVVEAALGPVLRTYLDRVAEGIGDGRLLLLTSAGGLVRSADFRAVDGLLSGPAGGVVGAVRAGLRSGFSRLVAFDMGGTSTDVSRFDGDLALVYEHAVGDAGVLAPALDIETVAAGGGSICGVRDGRVHVGPGSAGADPGPACYGRGGPLTLTDVNLLLGRLDPDHLAVPIDTDAAQRAFDAVRERLAEETGERPGSRDLLAGFRAVADERMVAAIRSVSLRRGFDPADHALIAFGGAGGQHACAVAERLGIDTVVVPADAGLLSAEGLRAAVVERFAHRQVLQPVAAVTDALAGITEDLGREACAAVAREGIDPAKVTVTRCVLRMRFVGQDAALEVEPSDGEDPADAFRARYAEVFGEGPSARAIEVESVRVTAAAAVPAVTPAAPVPATGAATPVARAAIGDLHDRNALAPGATIDGPALVRERFGGTVIDPGWTAAMDGAGALVLHRSASGTGTAAERPAAVERELFTHRFTAIAREMGEQLRRTAVSVNVKERRDFSCAVLDPDGSLVVNAPHIPVHLGSLGLCVRGIDAALHPGPGDVIVTNHPAHGGSHLPDVTLAAPVHDDAGVLIGWVANRAHHAELGGVRPGSMPPDARSLAEEGVVIPPTHLVRGGVPAWDAVAAILRDAPHPTRALEDNLADLRAALASIRRGAAALRALADRHGTDVLRRHMTGLQDDAARLVEAALRRVGDGTRSAACTLDDGTPLRVAITVADGRARIDFTGTAGVHPGSLNATPAVVRSVVLYVLRLLVDTALPLNEGLLRRIDLRLPEGLLSPPFDADPDRCPAVVGGNVETSQRLVELLRDALDLGASGQGTMNNVVLGGADWSLYETLGGGCGADAVGDGASGVHSHMTNTRITDIEVLEHRLPLRVERFGLRPGTGGTGRHRGGDGLVRELRFLAPATLSILTQHRTDGPPGAAGGAPGAPGAQHLERSDGSVEPLASVDGAECRPGDRLVVETPGGGGWGAA